VSGKYTGKKVFNEIRVIVGTMEKTVQLRNRGNIRFGQLLAGNRTAL